MNILKRKFHLLWINRGERSIYHIFIFKEKITKECISKQQKHGKGVILYICKILRMENGQNANIIKKIKNSLHFKCEPRVFYKTRASVAIPTEINSELFLHPFFYSVIIWVEKFSKFNNIFPFFVVLFSYIR